MNVNVSAKARDPFSAAQWHVDLKSVANWKLSCKTSMSRDRLET